MEIAYQLIRSARKTISIQIGPRGAIVVRCPRRCGKREVDAFVASKQDWIRKHLESIAKQPQLPAFSGDELQILAAQAAKVLPEKVKQYSEVIGVSYSRITIRSQKTRWGSCSAKGNLNFNCLLMLCPEAVRNYVVIHELCHRKQLNHSPEFWDEVEQYCPDYRTSRKWLKDNGGSLISRLP